MTKDQTRDALEACAKACFWGATKRARLEWILVRAGLASTQEASKFIRVCMDAHLLEDHHSWGWISVNPFLISVLDNWDSLTQDIPWTDDITEDKEPDDESHGTDDSPVL